MANSVWDQIKAAANIHEHPVEDVIRAVNNAVDMASGYKSEVSRQASAIAPEAREATLAGSVVGMEDAAQRQPTASMAPSANEPAAEAAVEEPVAENDGPEF